MHLRRLQGRGQHRLRGSPPGTLRRLHRLKGSLPGGLRGLQGMRQHQSSQPACPQQLLLLRGSLSLLGCCHRTLLLKGLWLKRPLRLLVQRQMQAAQCRQGALRRMQCPMELRAQRASLLQRQQAQGSCLAALPCMKTAASQGMVGTQASLVRLLGWSAGMLKRRQLLSFQLEALPCKQMERENTWAQVQSRPTATQGSSQQHARWCCRTVVASSWLCFPSLVLSSRL